MMTKKSQAEALLLSCIGTNGVWADPTRYRYQCWTRDLNLALLPALVAMGQTNAVLKHLVTLRSQQRPTGQIPILFLDDEHAWLEIKTTATRGKPSFMLQRYSQGELWNLTPGTTDSEMHYIIAVQEMVRALGSLGTALDSFHDRATEHAVGFIRKYRLNSNQLFVGCDWRDTMHLELGDKTLLTNNCLLYHAQVLLGMDKLAAVYRLIIQNTFFTNHQCVDYPGAGFEPLGAALAVLYDVADSEHYACILDGFAAADTPLGVATRCRHNPQSDKEAEVIERTDGVVVWPFVVGFVALALHKMGATGQAKTQFAKLAAHDGFHEWYDPADGVGYGASQQAWSAALFLRCCVVMGDPK